jgi:putative aldouronate transport system substrate-binding protein
MIKKKLPLLLLAVAMVFTMFSGCAKKVENSSSTPTKTTSVSTATHLEISIAYWDIGGALDPTVKDDAVRNTIEKKFNVTLKPFNVTWDDYKTKINTLAAANALPDVFADDAVTESSFSKWATQGVIKALPTDLSAYPVIQKYLSQTDVKDYKYPVGSKDAKYYCVPRPTYSTMDMWANDQTVMIRKDWMLKVGVTEVPTNMDEFISLMQKFVNNDPDGNNKKDTIGLTCYSAGWLANFMDYYEPAIQGGQSYWTKADDGTWVEGFTTAKALAGVQALKKLYDANGLDKDFATLKGNDGMNKFTSGVAGAYAHSGYPDTLETVYTAMQKANPSVDWASTVVLMKPFKTADGNYYRKINSTPWSETYFNAKCSDEKVSRMLNLMNWGLSTDGFNLLHYGIKDVDYTQSGTTITSIAQKDSKGVAIVDNINKYPILKNGFASFFTWAQDFSYANPSIPQVIRVQANEMLTWEKTNCKPAPINLTLNFVTYPAKDKCTFSFKDAIVKTLLAKDAAAAWKSVVSDNMKAGYTDATTQINAKAKELGITDYTEK